MHKKFSITKSFEFAFDMLVHHHIVFLQYAVIIGGLAWGSWCVNRYYLKPHAKRAVIILKNHVFSPLISPAELNRVPKGSAELKRVRRLLGAFLGTDLVAHPAMNTRKIIGLTAFDQVHDKMIFTHQNQLLTSGWRSFSPEEKHALALGVLCYIVSYILAGFVALLSLRLAIDLYSFHTINIPYSFNLTLRLLPLALLAWLLLDIITSIGLLLLIVPGIILYLRHSQILVLLADQRAISITEAFGMSARCTDGAKWHLALFSIIVMMIARWSAYTGWLYLMTAPCMALVVVHVYYQLLEQSPEVLAEGHCEATIER